MWKITEKVIFQFQWPRKLTDLPKVEVQLINGIKIRDSRMKLTLALSAGVVEYTDCFSAEG